jgi:DNA-binding HxlR family transcriptional regulator
MRRSSAPSTLLDGCPAPETTAAFLLLQERWVLFIIHALLEEPLGFNELSRRATGVSSATLAQRLELLEREGIITKQVLSTMPPRTEYKLTKDGARLKLAIEAIGAWGRSRRRRAEDD